MRKEILQKRNLNSKHFDIKNGKFVMNAHFEHIHYVDKKTKCLENVDCRFLSTGYGWEMRKNNYELEISKKADGWFKFINSFGYDSRGKVRVDRLNEIISIKPLGISSVKGESITKKEWKGKGIVLYKNAYGQDIDLEVMARNIGFVKEVVINKKPSDLSKDLEFSFEIDLGDKQVKPKKADYMNLQDEKIQAFKGLEGKVLLDKQKLYEDDLERDVWNKTSKLETSDNILLQGIRKTWFRKFNLYDSEGNQGFVKVRLKNIDGKIILTKVLDKRFLENAVYPVRTDTTTSYYAGAGDGWAMDGQSGQPSQANWNTVHDNTSADSSDTSGAEAAVRVDIYGSDDLIRVYRLFFPIDTSGLTAGATISAATLKLYFESIQDDYNGDGYDYLAIVETFQASTSALVDADYEDCGYGDSGEAGGHASDANIVKGSDNIDITGLSLIDYTDFVLNATGRGWINKTGWTKLGMREGHDIEDNFPGDPGEVNKISKGRIFFSEQTGTNKDPYLSVTYTAPASYTLTVTVGTFVLTGISVAFKKGYGITVSVGSFALTGIAAIFTKALSMTVSVGTFTLTGIASALTRGYTLVASVGAFILTGIVVALKRGYTIVASVGSFTLTGISVTFTKALNLMADVGTFTLIGIATTFTKALTMAVTVGVFTLTGISTAFTKTLTMIASVGSFTLTGISATLKSSRRLIIPTIRIKTTDLSTRITSHLPNIKIKEIIPIIKSKIK